MGINALKSMSLSHGLQRKTYDFGKNIFGVFIRCFLLESLAISVLEESNTDARMLPKCLKNQVKCEYFTHVALL